MTQEPALRRFGALLLRAAIRLSPSEAAVWGSAMLGEEIELYVCNTRDDEAGAYYWHRFFAHQPDLNFDNPEVHKEILKALGAIPLPLPLFERLGLREIVNRHLEPSAAESA